MTQLGKMLGGELQVAFALQNMIRDLHISKFQIRSPNSKKKNILYTLASFKKKKKTQKKKSFSYVHPIERVDEVGEMKTGNDYRGLVEGEGGSQVVRFYTVRRHLHSIRPPLLIHRLDLLNIRPQVCCISQLYGCIIVICSDGTRTKWSWFSMRTFFF